MTTTLPSGPEDVRRMNTAHVLRLLRAEGPTSRTGLAGRTGLAKATVGSIVGDLAERGVVVEDEAAAAGTRGRPSRPVRLLGESFLGLGLEVNVDYVAAVLVDLGGTAREPVTVALDPGADRLEALVSLARRVAGSAAREGARIVGATVAVPGLVGRDGRTVAWAPNLEWFDVRPGDALGDVLGVDVRVHNDANCAALAESVHGVASDVGHALYITGTVGIGAGVVEGGALVLGAAGFAGEVGHMPVGRPDALCGCGRHGCWEAAVGLRAMLAAVGEPEHETPLSSAEAVAARAADEPDVRAALAEVGEHLGHGVATLAAILDPAAVVLGGYFVPLGSYLLPTAEDVVAARLPSVELHRPQLRLSALGIQAAALGAAEDAVLDVLTGTTAL